MIRTILLIVFTLLLSLPQVHAQVFLEEGKKIHAVTPGERVSGTLTVYNTGDRPMKIKAYWEDFQYVAPFDGSKKFTPAGTGDKSFSSWAVFTPREFELPAHGKKKIEYAFDAPEDVTGGYYGVLFFENVTDSFIDKTGVNVVTRAGCLFFIESTDKRKQASLDNLSMEGNTVKGRFANQSNVVLIPNGTYYILDDAGVAQDRGEIKKLYLPPDGVGEVSFNLKDALSAGSYTAVVTFDLEGEVVVREIDFSKDASGRSKLLSVRE